MRPAKAQQPVAHVPKRARLKFKPDQEQHQHDAEFGEVLQVGGIGPGHAEDGPDKDPCRQIAEDGTKTKAHGQRHDKHRRAEIDAGFEEKAFHAADVALIAR